MNEDLSRIMSFFLLFIVIISCTEEAENNLFDAPKRAFIKDLEAGKSVQAHYWRQGALFMQDTIYKNRDSIDFYIKNIQYTGSFSSIRSIQHDSANCFELGYYNISKNNAAAPNSPNNCTGFSDCNSVFYLIAWKKEQGKWLKELEVLYPNTVVQPLPLAVIDQARKKWERLSNAHRHESLVEQLYAENAFYFNDGYVYRGRAAIQEKYSYMAKEKWHIRLATIETLQVSDSLFYDVGQYVSGGKGHYFILWQLQEDGAWQVLLDFNF